MGSMADNTSASTREHLGTLGYLMVLGKTMIMVDTPKSGDNQSWKVTNYIAHRDNRYCSIVTNFMLWEDESLPTNFNAAHANAHTLQKTQHTSGLHNNLGYV